VTLRENGTQTQNCGRREKKSLQTRFIAQTRQYSKEFPPNNADSRAYRYEAAL
jgi:hypothetical protein